MLYGSPHEEPLQTETLPRTYDGSAPAVGTVGTELVPADSRAVGAARGVKRQAPAEEPPAEAASEAAGSAHAARAQPHALVLAAKRRRQRRPPGPQQTT